MLSEKVVVFGQEGLVGSSLLNQLIKTNHNIVNVKRRDLDLTSDLDVNRWFNNNKPSHVYICAGRVGGIKANDTYPADFILQNSKIAINIINSSHLDNVVKLLYLGSPRDCPQPIKENYLLSGKLESTNEPYAIAKILGINLCKSYKRQYNCNFISAMPTNLYGPNDKYHLNDSHVIPSLILKFYLAKKKLHKNVSLLGSGKATREFLYVDDLSKALIFLMKNYDGDEHINIGSGYEIEIKNLAKKIKDLIGYEGSINFENIIHDDGTPRKLLDSSKISNLGWVVEEEFDKGLSKTYDWFIKNIADKF